nr:immunoglobulin light chain junction region [Macaca mulatta]MOY07847.1 immunoglobulin light chain junction region [Macaca mulatta]MOY08693.1 immunoglobulin light chain junction region [Macaca mulatta]MOY09932.1 immunoglobulin light chain junction region [Macaca mulatta]
DYYCVTWHNNVWVF